MKLKSFLFVLAIVFAFGFQVQAQNCDPWIVQIYKELYKRSPTATECNIRNYNNGSWNSYGELQNYIKSYVSRQSSSSSSSSNTTQNCDPWIVQIYKQEYNRTPSAEECNIRNYNNGSWGSYAELTNHIKSYNSRKSSGNTSNAGNTAVVKTTKLEGDPWIFRAYKEAYRREPIAFELNPKLYNNGTWRSYAELKRYVQEFQTSLRKQNVEIRSIDTQNGNQLTGLFMNGQQVAVSLISKNGGNVVAAGGMNVVSAGGANVVSAGGMNVVSAGGLNVIAPGGANVISVGGGNVVSAGGANISILQNSAGLNFGGRYTVQSEGSQVIPTSGKGAIIIR